MDGVLSASKHLRTNSSGRYCLNHRSSTSQKMYRPTCTFLSPFSPYAPSFLCIRIWTLLYPLLYLCLPFSTFLSVPSSLSSFLPSFLRFFIYTFLSMFEISSSHKIKEIYSFCTLIPTYQTIRHHMPKNINIKVFVHIKEAMTYSQDYIRTILCNWNAVQSNEVEKQAPDRCPVPSFRGHRTSS